VGEKPEMCLRNRGRHRTSAWQCDRTIRGCSLRDGLPSCQVFGDTSNRWCRKKLYQRNSACGHVLHTRQHMHGEQRVATQLKEIIVHADLRTLQELFPEAYDLLFHGGAWRYIPLWGSAREQRRRWQVLTIDFATWGQW